LVTRENNENGKPLWHYFIHKKILREDIPLSQQSPQLKSTLFFEQELQEEILTYEMNK